LFFCPKNKHSPKKGLRRIWSVFVTQKQAFTEKKRSSPDLECLYDPKKGLRLIWNVFMTQKNIFAGLEAFFVPQMAQDTSLRGAKVVQGWPKYLQGGSCPPAPLLPAPMARSQWGFGDRDPALRPLTLKRFLQVFFLNNPFWASLV